MDTLINHFHEEVVMLKRLNELHAVYYVCAIRVPFSRIYYFHFLRLHSLNALKDCQEIDMENKSPNVIVVESSVSVYFTGSKSTHQFIGHFSQLSSKLAFQCLPQI
jgi:hypothetical protein